MKNTIKTLLLLALSVSAGAAAPVTIQDAEGKPFVVKDTSRVVTLGGPVTEIVYALGAGRQVIATDVSSYYPAAVNRLPKIGYQRQLTAEGIISLKPSLVVATTEAGPPTTIAQLKAAGVPVLILPVEYSPEGTQAKISALGKIFAREEKATQLNTLLSRDIAKAEALKSAFKTKPRVMFIYARGPQGAQIGGKNTAAHAMIELAGAQNAFGSVEGYKPLTPEAAVQANPDIILMMEKGLESVGGIEGALKLPGIAQTKAAKNRAIVSLDDLYLLGFATRLGRATYDLTLKFHPEMTGSERGR